jgi:hypothetical protein
MRVILLMSSLAAAGLMGLAGEAVRADDSTATASAGLAADLRDCVLFFIEGGLEGTRRAGDRTPSGLALLPQLFERGVCSEALFQIGSYSSSWPAMGRVHSVIVPGQHRSLGFRDAGGELQAIWGFYPPLTQGRVPRNETEAVIVGPDSKALTWTPDEPEKAPEIGIPAVPRAVGSIFTTLFFVQPRRYTVVGLTPIAQDGLETIWTTSVPTVPPPGRGAQPGECIFGPGWRASAFLTDMSRYDSCRDALAATYLEWRAVRIRDGRVDTSWRHKGYDAPAVHASTTRCYTSIPGHEFRRFIELYLRADWGPRLWEDQGPPLDVSDMRVDYGGKPIAVTWRKLGGKETVARIERPGTYEGEITVPEDAVPKSFSVYIRARLECACRADYW